MANRILLNDIRRIAIPVVSISGTSGAGYITYIQTEIRAHDSGLTTHEKEAWDKILFGGLGIMLALVLFILYLFLKARKQKKKNIS